MDQTQQKLKFRNIYLAASSSLASAPSTNGGGGKAFFTNVKVEATALTKLKICSGGNLAALPDSNGHSIGILKLPSAPNTTVSGGEEKSRLHQGEARRCKDHCPLTLVHQRQIQDFEFSSALPFTNSLLASTCRTDSLIRIWSLPAQDIPDLPFDDSSSSTIERDTPNSILASHEGRIDHLRFNGKNGNILATSSQDGTIKIWDLEGLMDKITLEVSTEEGGVGGLTTCLAWDLNGNYLLSGTTMGFLNLYDSRASVTPVSSVCMAGYLPSKGMKVTMTLDETYFISTGFTKEGGGREVNLHDFRYLSSNSKSLGNYKFPEVSSSPLQPYMDVHLPILYLFAKGEPLRIMETDQGTLIFNSLLKWERQPMAVDLNWHDTLNKKKCEIARFTLLTNDKTLEGTSIYVPRKEGVGQDDLYPLSNPLLMFPDKVDWFMEKSSPLEDGVSSSLNIGHSRSSSKVTGGGGHSKNPSSTSRSGTGSGHSKTVSTISTNRTSTSTVKPGPDSNTIYEGYLEQQLDGWLVVEWTMKYVILKGSRIYASTSDDLSLSPLVKYETISKLKAIELPWKMKLRDEGFEFESSGKMFRFRAESTEIRNIWVERLGGCLPPPKSPGNSLNLINSTTSIYQKKINAVLMHALECASQDVKGLELWTMRTVCLDSEAMMHFYPTSLKGPLPSSEPEESLDLSLAWSVRRNKNLSFTINTPKRAYHFKTKSEADLKDWIQSIGSQIPEFLVKCKIIEGPVSAKLLDPSVHAGWLVFINSTLFYFPTQFSTRPISIIDVREVKSFGDIVDYFSTDDDTSPSSSTEIDPIKILVDNATNIVHLFSNKEEFKYWIYLFDQIRRSSWDLASRLKIGDTFSFEGRLDEYEKDPSKALRSACVYSEAEINSGTLKMLIKIQDSMCTVVPINPSSLADDSSFVLDMGDDIYHWSGTSATRVCRAEGLNLASSIRKYRNSKPKLHIADAEDPPAIARFFEVVGCAIIEPLSPTRLKKQVSFIKTPHEKLRIFQYTDEDPRNLRFIYQGDRPSKAILIGGACLLQKENQIYLWFEKLVSIEQKITVKFFASRLLQVLDKGKYGFLYYSEEHQGRETPLFKSLFFDFPCDLPISMQMSAKKGNIAKEIAQDPIDIQKLLHPVPDLPKLDLFPGTFKFYKIKAFDKVLISSNGKFARTESYVLAFTYRPPQSGVDKCILYFWQGSMSSIIEKGTSALISIEMSKETGCEVNQVRVLEGKEPPAFHYIFKQDCIVITKDAPVRVPSDTLPMIFELRDYQGLAKAFEVTLDDFPQEARDTLVVLTGSHSWILHQNNPPVSVQKGAEWIVKQFGHNSNLCEITTEKFLSSYLSALKITNWTFNSQSRANGKLFTCSGASGMVKIEAVENFTQSDLDLNCVMILDCLSNVYLWFGFYSKVQEQIMGIETMQAYLKCLKREGDRLQVTYPFEEPLDFLNQFHGWTKLNYPKDSVGLPPKTRLAVSILDGLQQKEYPKDILLSSNCPDHIDRTILELYLSELEFKDTFKMTKAEYLSILPWKRDPLRRQVGFF